jgi:hypothetical protein
MSRWSWYLCGSVYAKQTALLRNHEAEDYESTQHAASAEISGSRSGSRARTRW